MDESQLQGRLSYMVPKHVAFAPASQKQLGSRLPLSSPPGSNRARSAFLTVFSPYSLRQAREPDCVGRQGCLSAASSAAD